MVVKGIWLTTLVGCGADQSTPVDPAQPPAPPSGLSATAVSTTQIDLTWIDNAGTEAGFRIERAPGGTTSFAEIASVGANFTGFSNTGLTPGTPYAYRVRADNAAGPSGYSNVATASTQSAPAAPSNLTATAVSTTEVDLSWTDNAGNETSFVIERAPGGTTNFAEIAAVGMSITVFSDSGLTSGTPYAYRVRADNQFGLSSYSNVAMVTTLRFFYSVSPGDRFTCSVIANNQILGGAAYCWGENEFGQLGDGTTTDRTTPVSVSGGHEFAVARAGGGHTCGLTIGGTALCWGRNTEGQLGDGTTTNHLTPATVSGSLTFRAVSAGWVHTCGVAPLGAAYCWGSNGNGALGNGTTTDRLTPDSVSGGLTYYVVSAGGQHTCGVTATAAAYCWGANFWHQLGDGTTTDRWTPVPVSGGLAFTEVGAGTVHTCGLTTAGAAYCWGRNDHGQLGDGTATDRSAPVLVLGGLRFSTISVGGLHTCGLTVAGAVYCWGENEFGRLGDGSTTDRWTPVLVLGGLTFAAVNAGSQWHTCGVSYDGGAFCWGNNESGGLGDGTTTNRLIPTAVMQP